MENKDIFVTATRDDCNSLVFSSAGLHTQKHGIYQIESRYDRAHITYFNDVSFRKSRLCTISFQTSFSLTYYSIHLNYFHWSV